MSLFVDTSALYAFLVRSDADHGAVATAFRSAAESGRRLVTTSYVLVETSALLQHRIGLDPVRDLEGRIGPLLQVIWVGEDLHRRALARLFRMNRRHVSLVDAVSFTVMEAEGVTDVLALDADFTAEGFRLIP
ncbi:MAG: PIN domain-containing protein [Gemmatimonadales bacterium]|nr:PIN domain-containing protein [Gemmatimonadales bacterium]